MQLVRRFSAARLGLPQAKLSRNSNQIAHGRIRRFESYMPSQADQSPHRGISQMGFGPAFDPRHDSRRCAQRSIALAFPFHEHAHIRRQRKISGRFPTTVGVLALVVLGLLEPSISGPLLPPNVGMGQTRSGRSARLSPKVLAISAHTIFKLEQTAGAAVNDAFLRQIVDNFRRHPKTARQSVG
jgi:hypothetical protein